MLRWNKYEEGTTDKGYLESSTTKYVHIQVQVETVLGQQLVGDLVATWKYRDTFWSPKEDPVPVPPVEPTMDA